MKSNSLEDLFKGTECRESLNSSLFQTTISMCGVGDTFCRKICKEYPLIGRKSCQTLITVYARLV